MEVEKNLYERVEDGQVREILAVRTLERIIVIRNKGNYSNGREICRRADFVMFHARSMISIIH